MLALLKLLNNGRMKQRFALPNFNILDDFPKKKASTVQEPNLRINLNSFAGYHQQNYCTYYRGLIKCDIEQDDSIENVMETYEISTTISSSLWKGQKKCQTEHMASEARGHL